MRSSRISTSTSFSACASDSALSLERSCAHNAAGKPGKYFAPRRLWEGDAAQPSPHDLSMAISVKSARSQIANRPQANATGRPTWISLSFTLGPARRNTTPAPPVRDARRAGCPGCGVTMQQEDLPCGPLVETCTPQTVCAAQATRGMGVTRAQHTQPELSAEGISRVDRHREVLRGAGLAAHDRAVGARHAFLGSFLPSSVVHCVDRSLARR